VLNPQDTEKIIGEVLKAEQLERYSVNKELDFSYSLAKKQV
jgi:Tfp pilus assembly pilus retraction ATPase PilT